MPKVVDKKRKREEIAQQAVSLFAEKGFEKTAVREITARAGMGKGTFYEYFQDKEDVLNAIADLMISQWRDMFLKVLEQESDPAKALDKLVVTSLDSLADFEQLTLLYFDLLRLGALKEKKFAFTQNLRQFLTEALDVVESLIVKGKTTKAFRQEVDARAVASALLAFVDGVCLHAMVFDKGRDYQAVWRGFYTCLLRGMS